MSGGELWVVGAGGADARRLTSLQAGRLATAPAWSPAGTTIAFVVVGPATAPAPNDVWTVRPDGTALTRVGSYAFVDGGADWAPDGRSLVYAAARNRDDDVALYRAAVPGGRSADIGNPHAWEETPAFAPNGRRLAFVVRHGPGYLRTDVWTLDLRTGARRNLTGTASGRPCTRARSERRTGSRSLV